MSAFSSNTSYSMQQIDSNPSSKVIHNIQLSLTTPTGRGHPAPTLQVIQVADLVVAICPATASSSRLIKRRRSDKLTTSQPTARGFLTTLSELQHANIFCKTHVGTHITKGFLNSSNTKPYSNTSSAGTYCPTARRTSRTTCNEP